MAVPFSAVPKYAMSPFGHLITGVPDRYAFEIHSPRSRSVVSVRRNVSTRAVSGHERDSARSAVIERMRQTDPAWLWTGPEVPRVRPYYDGLFAADDGRVWIAVVGEVARRAGSINMGGPAAMGGGSQGRQPPPRISSASDYKPPPPAPARYDVYEPNGAYVGQVEIPPNVSSVVRRGNHLWALRYDDDDVQYVVRYRIAWK
jgi:hypothetical protein